MKIWQIVTLALIAGASAMWIWLRDLTWQDSGPDALFLLGCLPFLWFAGRPWSRRVSSDRSILPWAVAGIVTATAGVFLSIGFLLALGWTLFAFGFLRSTAVSGSAPALRRLAPFALLSFPWILVDGQAIGWFFRYSGAICNELVFRLLGMAVHRTGVYLTVNDIQLRVEAECAGLNNLQAMLLAGGFLSWQILGRSSAARYWGSWLLLPLLAWLANAIRIFCLGVAGLTMGTDFASGAFHAWGGWLTLCLMFGGAMLLFRQLAEPVRATRITVLT